MHDPEHEALVHTLKDPAKLEEFVDHCRDARPGLAARLLGGLLIKAGNAVYGHEPSYEKFKAVEVIARIPYQSWESVAYTMLTAFYGDEFRAIRLAKVLPFARHAHDNETMHVVVISQIVRRMGRNKFFRHTFIPLLFSFFYYWAIWLISFFDKRVAFELNFLFETHAFQQYARFLKHERERLQKTAVTSAFLKFYGREAENEFELFASIMIDEAIHRHASWQMAEELSHGSIS